MAAGERNENARGVLDAAADGSARPAREPRASLARRLGWFVALWLGGVAAVSLVATGLRAVIAG